MLFWSSPIYAHTEEELELYSESAILMDANSGVILYEKQKTKKCTQPASQKSLVDCLRLKKAIWRTS